MEEIFWIGLVVVIVVGFVLLHVVPPTDEATLPEPKCAHCEALAIGGDGRTTGPRVISSEVSK